MELNQFRDVDLVIDKANDNFIQCQFVSQGDYKGRTMTVQVTDNGLIGKVPGLTLNLRWRNQASGLADLSAFECIDVENSIFRIEYPEQMMTPGKVVANIQVIQDGKVTHLKSFELTVQKLVGEMTGIVEQAEYGALVAVLADANKFRTDINSLALEKADKDYITNELSKITYIPETFANLAAINAKYPNGKNGLMVAADNGHKYIWSGGAWTDAGVYQSLGIAADSVTNYMLKDNNATGIVLTTKPITFDKTTRVLTIPEGSAAVAYLGKSKLIATGDVTGIGSFGFIVADVSGNTAVIKYAVGNDLTTSTVIVGGVVGNNLYINGEKVANLETIPDGVSVGMALTEKDMFLETNSSGDIELVIPARTSFISKNTFFILESTKILTSGSVNGFFVANRVSNSLRYATGDELSTLDSSWFIFGGMMNKKLYVNGRFIDSNKNTSRKILYLGDSITVGFRTTDESTHNYPTEVNLLNRLPFVRYAVTGSTIAGPQEGNAFVERAANIDFSQATDIVIFGGHNDYKHSKLIGFLDSVDTTTVLGALNTITAKIYADNPKAKIRMITPNWRVVKENDPDSTIDNDTDVWVNSAGLKFNDYLEALKSFAKSNGFPCLNLKEEWAVNKSNQKQWLVDGLHPNDAGQEFLGETVEKFLR